jgi:hypothetical protein
MVMRIKKSARKVNRGQALVETLVAAVVLLPLLLLTIYLGKLQTVQQSTLAASRSLAFECQVSFDACAKLNGGASDGNLIADELRRRHFMNASVAIRSNEFSADAANDTEKQSLWKDHKGQALLESYGDIGFRIDPDVFNAGSGVVKGNGAKLAANAMDIISNVAGPARFGLDWQGGLIDAKVQATLSKSQTADALVSSLSGMPLTMRARTAILTNAWNASSAIGGEESSTQSRVDKGKKLPLIDPVIDAMYLPTRGFIELADSFGLESNGDRFKYHSVDPTVIPKDRNKGYVAPVSLPVFPAFDGS